MEYELISEADYENLPEEREKKFVAIEQVCRRNLFRLISHSTSPDFDEVVRLHYMSIVSETADELEIPGIKFVSESDEVSENLKIFLMDVAGVVARIRLRSSGVGDRYSVRLSAKSRALIGREVERLREIISNAQLPEAKRKALFQKLNELLEEIDGGRLVFGKALAIVAFVAAGCATATSFFADAPDALATITKLIGIDKAAEEAEVRRLSEPARPRALPAPAQREDVPEPSRASSFLDPQDEEIPF